VATYEIAGCGALARPRCTAQPFDRDACFSTLHCGCDGRTIGGCPFPTEPFASYGPCDARDDTAGDGRLPVLSDGGSDAFPPYVGDSGWEWNVNCPRSIDGLCAGGETPCVRDWADASKPATWCAVSTVEAINFLGSCGGYWVVLVFGKANSATDFLEYHYDVFTGKLVRVDSDAIPSVTQCVAGVSGAHLDRCPNGDSQLIYCNQL
jgi:hypothetical protein